jgi:hypothetical protein
MSISAPQQPGKAHGYSQRGVPRRLTFRRIRLAPQVETPIFENPSLLSMARILVCCPRANPTNPLIKEVIMRKLLLTPYRRLAILVAGGLLSVSASVYAMGMNNAPCDGFMDCVYTAYWWAFLR